MAKSVVPPVREGDVVAGKYRIERVLGAGGMGVVVAARHLALKQQVAIKFLLPAAMASIEGVARFLREAEAAARLDSEHVTRVLDAARLDDGTPYMVMEFLEGRDLAEVLEKRGPLPVEEAVGYALEACVGIAEAHAAGIVHRDIKPSNFFLSERGGRRVVKVLDFGISKTTTDQGAEAALTQSTAFMGSPLYMSPEQMTSAKNVDARTDVWSTGATLFELVTGRVPFVADSVTEVIASVLQREAPSARELRPDLPPGFPEALAGALRKDRNQRYADIGAFAAAIAPFGPRHAGLLVERISLTLGGARNAPFELAETVQSGGVAAASGESGAVLGSGAVAANSAPKGGTTAQPVWVDERAAPSARVKSSRVAVPLAAVAVLAAGGVLWLKPSGDGAPGSASAEPNGAAPSAAPSAASSPLVTAPATAPSVRAVLDAGAARLAPPPSASAAVPAVRPRPRKRDPFDRRE